MIVFHLFRSKIITQLCFYRTFGNNTARLIFSTVLYFLNFISTLAGPFMMRAYLVSVSIYKEIVSGVESQLQSWVLIGRM